MDGHQASEVFTLVRRCETKVSLIDMRIRLTTKHCVSALPNNDGLVAIRLHTILNRQQPFVQQEHDQSASGKHEYIVEISKILSIHQRRVVKLNYSLPCMHRSYRGSECVTNSLNLERYLHSCIDLLDVDVFKIILS